MKKTAAADRPDSPNPNGVARAIVKILKQQENGLPTKEICREHGISEATFYNRRAAPWKSKYGGMQVADVKRLKDLEPGRRSGRECSLEERGRPRGCMPIWQWIIKS